MNDDEQSSLSSYLDLLPAVYQEGARPGLPHFLGRFLLAFEKVLSGRGDIDEPGLEEILEGIVGIDGAESLGGIQRYFDPGPDLPDSERAPREFIGWLAGWVALVLREDLNEEHQRRFIARVASLYRLRGTKQGLKEVLEIYTGMGVVINEMITSFQVGVSQVGVNTMLGGGAPHFFTVTLMLPDADPDLMRLQRKIAQAIIDIEKPAHTFYRLFVETPLFQIGVHSQIGVDTLIGARTI